MVSGLSEHGRLTEQAGFFEAVRTWRPMHDEVVRGFQKVKRGADTHELRDADERVYLNDPKFDLAVLDPIIDG